MSRIYSAICVGRVLTGGGAGVELEKALKRALVEADEAEAALARERARAQQTETFVTMLDAYTKFLVVLTGSTGFMKTGDRADMVDVAAVGRDGGENRVASR